MYGQLSFPGELRNRNMFFAQDVSAYRVSLLRFKYVWDSIKRNMTLR